jgi:hypothetical protein
MALRAAVAHAPTRAASTLVSSHACLRRKNRVFNEALMK